MSILTNDYLNIPTTNSYNDQGPSLSRQNVPDFGMPWSKTAKRRFFESRVPRMWDDADEDMEEDEDVEVEEDDPVVDTSYTHEGRKLRERRNRSAAGGDMNEDFDDDMY
jgi:hypothetical protein